jgi:hypothetical protein
MRSTFYIRCRFCVWVIRPDVFTSIVCGSKSIKNLCFWKDRKWSYVLVSTLEVNWGTQYLMCSETAIMESPFRRPYLLATYCILGHFSVMQPAIHRPPYPQAVTKLSLKRPSNNRKDHEEQCILHTWVHPPYIPTVLAFSAVQGVKPWHASETLTHVFNDLWDKLRV